MALLRGFTLLLSILKKACAIETTMVLDVVQVSHLLFYILRNLFHNMSVYSGFATRVQETTYLKFVEKLLSIMAGEILVLRGAVAVEESQVHRDKKIVKAFKAMRAMERQKYMEPHFSTSFEGLARYIYQYLVRNTNDDHIESGLGYRRGLSVRV